VTPALSGTYGLVLASPSAGLVRIGRLGMLPLRRGFYVYVGSAFGPGGLAARLHHHRQVAVRPHWHVGYLRAVCEVVEVWFTREAVRCEHAWAEAVARLPGAGVPMPGFGSSDCGCESHLFFLAHRPSVAAFRRRVTTPVGSSSF
jgi:Uri superfamily endonuclease